MSAKGAGPNLKYDFTDLNRFVRLMDSAGKYVVKVGIFGNKTTRGATSPNKAKNGGLRKVFKVPQVKTNAEIGFLHEFGSESGTIPMRSFLRMPLAIKSKEILADAFKGAAELLAKGQIKQILARLGVACEKQIQLAFASSGFGQWKPDAPLTVAIKGSSTPLIDTAQLRRSIASQVSES